MYGAALLHLPALYPLGHNDEVPTVMYVPVEVCFN